MAKVIQTVAQLKGSQVKQTDRKTAQKGASIPSKSMQVGGGARKGK